ncbi:MAG: carboxypeptidase-like regulatory domain-containing protein [Acidobacteriota bacterium]|nr:carboxypeptidase-like regulatory domain-containing protein [Acidobacteriota bacterium]
MHRQLKWDMVRRIVAGVVMVGLALGPQVTVSMAAGPAGNVVIRGVVFSGETQEPVLGARVYAVHLDTKQVFSSAPSTATGEYQLTGLPYGYYDLAVETPDGLYLANRVINAPAGEKVEMSMLLGSPQPEDTEWWSAEPDRRIPGLDRVPDGVSRIIEGIPRKSALAAIASGKAAAGGAAAAGTGVSTAAVAAGTASWLIPVLAAGGLAALAVVADDDDDSAKDQGGSPFE